MSIVANLTAMLTANTSNFESGMKRSQKSMAGFQSGLLGVGRAVNQFGGVIAGGALIFGLKRAIDNMDEMVKAADRIGISVESFSKLAYAGKLADVSMEDLEKTITKMQRAIIEADDGVATYSDAFDKLGLKASEFKNLSPEDSMIKLADALVKIENPTLRNAIALDIFGRSGTKLVNLAGQGAEGLRQMFEEAERLGVVINDKTARSAEKLNDDLTRMGQALNGVLLKAADTGALDSLAGALEVIIGAVVFLTEKYGDLLRVLGADISTVDVANRVIDDTNRKLEENKKILERQQSGGVGKYFDELVHGQGAHQKAIEKTIDESVRLNKVLDNAKKTVESIENPAPKPKPTNVDIPKTAGGTSPAKVATQELKEQEIQVKELDRAYEDLGQTFSSAFEDAVVQGKKFSDVLRGLAQDILRIATRRLVTDPLSSAASSIFSSIGSSIFGGSGGAPIQGGIGPSVGGSIFDSILGAFGFADGGIPPTNRMSIVGERGPELFVPSTRGTIIPNESLGMGGNVYQIDARGTDSSVVRRLEQSLMALAGPGVVEQRVVDAQKRGSI